MPPRPSSGSGASRVQITKPSAAGSPDATPSVNGLRLEGGLRRGRRKAQVRRKQAGAERALQQRPAIDREREVVAGISHGIR